MKRKIHWFIILLPFLILSSCEKDFVVPEQNAARRLVINSIFSDAWQMTVYLTYSYSSSGSNNINAVADARVELYEDGVFKEVLSYVPSDTIATFGSYRSQLIAQPGKRYLIKAIHPTYGTATAEDEMPLPVEIISHELLQYPDTFNNLEDAEVKFAIRDDGTKENFYRLNTWIEATYRYVSNSGDTIESTNYYSLRPELLSQLTDTVRDGGWFVLFSDKNFSGQQKEVNLLFKSVPYANYTYSLKLLVELYTVSKTHFEYFRTLDMIGGGPSEPVHVYTNVQNGYGIFAAEDFQRMEFVIK